MKRKTKLIEHVVQYRNEIQLKSWGNDFGRAAEKFLREWGIGGRAYMRIGHYSVVTTESMDQLAAGKLYDDYGPTDEFSADRIVQMANVIERLWQLKNNSKQFPLHDELMADIQHEVESWGQPRKVKGVGQRCTLISQRTGKRCRNKTEPDERTCRSCCEKMLAET